MNQSSITTLTKPVWSKVVALLVLLAVGSVSHAQEGSQGNTTVFSGAQMTLFGNHTFVTGGNGTQNGIIKTIRTAPFGIVSYSIVASHTAATNTSHVDGYVGKYGTTAFTFPIGNGTKLRPVSISAPASGDFKAAYWFSNPNAATLPAGAPFLVANRGTGISAVSNIEYWDVDGPSAVNLTLSWDAASALTALTGGVIANLVVVGYNPTTSKWENLGRAGGTTGTLATIGTITANGVTPNTYSAFTFGAAVATTPDLRPLITMAQRNFIKSTVMSRPLTIRVANIGATGTTAAGVVNVYLSAGLNFTVTLSGTSNWTLANDGGGEYTLTSTVSIPRTIPASTSDIPLILTAKSTVTKGNYNLSVIIEDNSGGETNNTNNGVSSDISVAVN